MWLLDRFRRTKKTHVARKVVVGLIIGGAIGSIVGKKLLDQHGAQSEDDDEKESE